MKNVIVIHEADRTDNDKVVIGVASNREKALEIINQHYGEHVMTNFKDVRESIDFTCNIKTEGKFGRLYDVCGECFTIDSI